MLSHLLWSVAGIVLLYFGSEWLVGGAVRFAHRFGVRPVVVGLTIVAYGTSLPEFAVSLSAAASGQCDIALANVIGSNITNLALVLGLTALLLPPKVEGGLWSRDLPVCLAASVIVPLLLGDGRISRFEGALLLGGAVAFTVAALRKGKDGGKREEPEEIEFRRLPTWILLLLGFFMLPAGSRLLLHGAVSMATDLGISGRVIGLTMVALGTSLPELSTSLMAAWRGHGSIAVGNVIGSNIFNLLFVLGGAASVRPLAASIGSYAIDLCGMLLVSLLAAWLLRKARTLRRWEGLLLVLCYIVFLVLI